MNIIFSYCEYKYEYYSSRRFINIFKYLNIWYTLCWNRPGVAGAVLQSPLWFFNSFIHSLTHPLVHISSKHWHSKPEELRSWNFEGMFIPHNVSCVTCHMSLVTCHNKIFFLHSFYLKKKSLIKVGQRGEAGWWRTCFQRGLRHLVH